MFYEITFFKKAQRTDDGILSRQQAHFTELINGECEENAVKIAQSHNRNDVIVSVRCLGPKRVPCKKEGRAFGYSVGEWREIAQQARLIRSNRKVRAY